MPYSYHAALGALLAGPLAHYRATSQGQQNLLGFGGPSATANTLDAAARLSFATGLILTGVSAASGNQALPEDLRTLGAVSLTGGVADGFATLQDGIRRESLPGILAGAFSLGSSFSQMTSFSHYDGVNAQGMPSDVRPKQVNLTALGLGVLSIGARIWDQLDD